jgi:hypothetical protein
MRVERPDLTAGLICGLASHFLLVWIVDDMLHSRPESHSTPECALAKSQLLSCAHGIGSPRVVAFIIEGYLARGLTSKSWSGSCRPSHVSSSTVLADAVFPVLGDQPAIKCNVGHEQL